MGWTSILAKVRIVDFSDWFPYEGFAEGSGRSEKIWLQSKDNKIGLFKYPKFDNNSLELSSEYISEHMAHRIGNLLGVETADVDIGNYKGRKGCMSYLINEPDEAVVEGAVFISGKHPDYNLENMQEMSTGKYYCLDHLLEVSDSTRVINRWIQMMIFDYLIGNSDRHQNNWAILVSYADENKNSLKGRVCPLYDNGSSLCSYVNETLADGYLGKDIRRFESLVDTKSRSMIRIDGFNKKHPKHSEVVEKLLSDYMYAAEFGRNVVLKMSDEVIVDLLEGYDGILSNKKKELIKRYLIRKVELLQQLLKKGTS